MEWRYARRQEGVDEGGNGVGAGVMEHAGKNYSDGEYALIKENIVVGRGAKGNESEGGGKLDVEEGWLGSRGWWDN